MVVDGPTVITPTRDPTQGGQDAQGQLASGERGGDQVDQSPEAQDLAGELDLNHAAEPGGLEEIGTCRRCGFIVAQDNQGRWRHQPSVGEIDAGEAWLASNPAAATAGQNDW
jgi:hypothetical protein